MAEQTVPWVMLAMWVRSERGPAEEPLPGRFLPLVYSSHPCASTGAAATRDKHSRFGNVQMFSLGTDGYVMYGVRTRLSGATSINSYF